MIAELRTNPINPHRLEISQIRKLCWRKLVYSWSRRFFSYIIRSVAHVIVLGVINSIYL